MEQLSLFKPGEIMIIRPQKSLMINEILRKNVVDELLDDKYAGMLTDYFDDLDDAKNCINVVLEKCNNTDGYYIARELDDEYCIEPDAKLVDFLDGIDSIVYSQYKKLEKQWVIDNDIKPKFNVGDTVKIISTKSNKLVNGEITKIDTDVAEYYIFISEDGHVKQGQGTHATIKKFEDIEKLVTEIK